MEDGRVVKRLWPALAVLPIAVLAFGLGWPLGDALPFEVGRPAYYLVVLGVTAVIYAAVLGTFAERAWRRSGPSPLEDPITDLPGVELFKDRLEQLILVGDREGSRALVVVMGLDRFTSINSALGRANADALLRYIAQRLQQTLRDSDSVCRLESDRFGILLPSAEHGEGAVTVVDKICKAFEKPFFIETRPVEVSATFGIAISPTHGRDADSLVANAEAAMADAKRAGSLYEFYSSEKHEMNADRIGLVAELRQAIDRHQLLVFYQPKHSFEENRVAGVEALVRWLHPERGFIRPDVFIPLAEETELIRPLTRYVLNEAFEQLSDWKRKGNDIKMAVNISARNLMDTNLPMDIALLLDQYRIDPRDVELEITESTIMNDPSRAMMVLQALTEVGIKIALDDYGTGYTSLSYLTRLPLSTLKIDKSFVQNMDRQRQDSLIVQSTIELGKHLGLDVVAEGVETERHWDKLAELGCTYAQGFYISRPLPAHELSFN